MDKIQVSGKVSIFLQLIPYTAMASLIFPAILYVDENIWIGIIASLVAVIASLKKLPIIGVVLFPTRIYNEICGIDIFSLFINIYTKDAASFVHG